MAILNYTTSIDSEKSILEIQKCLSKRGANKIITDYKNGQPEELTFCLERNGQMIAFSLPANYNGVFKAMEKDKSVPRSKCNEQQARRVAWRILKDWVIAQMAIVDAQMAEMAEVFFPYALTKAGVRLYSALNSNQVLMQITNTKTK